MSVLFQCFITLEKSSTFLSKAYLCKSHENVNFKLKLIKRLKKLEQLENLTNLGNSQQLENLGNRM